MRLNAFNIKRVPDNVKTGASWDEDIRNISGFGQCAGGPGVEVLDYRGGRVGHREAAEEVQLALEALREWEFEPPTLDEVARKAGLTPRTLQRRLSALLGTRPSAILSRVRLEKALSLLRETRLPLAEITDRIGYSLPSQLSRAVKQSTGLSPREYRERWRWAADES